MSRTGQAPLAAALLIAAFAPLAARADSASGKPPPGYSHPYTFSSDWHSHAIPTWEKALARYKGRENLRYLEVGVFQGRSFFWLLENIATHPTSRLVGLDINTGPISANVALSGAADRIELLEGRSQDLLRDLPSRSFDIIYVDGSHRGDDVLIDAVYTFSLLAEGGTLIFDDYRWHTQPGPTSRLVLPPELRPKEAIDQFLTLLRDQLELVDRGYQLIVRRRNPLCTGSDTRFCSPIGAYRYDWSTRVVTDPATNQPVALTPKETEVVEELIRSLPLGELRVHAPADRMGEPAVASVARKLGLPKGS